MIQMSLGLIETIGLVAAVEAADAAVKSANVRLVGYERAKGSGMITVKIEGEVGAVKAAVSAAAASAAKVGKVVSTLVIARPSGELEGMIRSSDTVGNQNPPAETPEPEAKWAEPKAGLSQAYPEPERMSDASHAEPEPETIESEPKQMLGEPEQELLQPEVKPEMVEQEQAPGSQAEPRPESPQLAPQPKKTRSPKKSGGLKSTPETKNPK